MQDKSTDEELKRVVGVSGFTLNILNFTISYKSVNKEKAGCRRNLMYSGIFLQV